MILNPSRTHTTFGKQQTTNQRTPSESAHNTFTHNYSIQERKGMITPDTN